MVLLPSTYVSLTVNSNVLIVCMTYLILGTHALEKEQNNWTHNVDKVENDTKSFLAFFCQKWPIVALFKALDDVRILVPSRAYGVTAVRI